MLQQLLPGLRIKLLMTVLLGLGYPLAITGISQLVFPRQANGSLVSTGGNVIGSAIIGQSFSRTEYFHPRPSAAGAGYDATASGGANLGPTSAKLILGTTKLDDKKNEVVDYDGISLRVVHYCVENNLPYDSSIALDKFRGTDGQLDDVKLIKAFNDANSPLIFASRAPIPADAVTASASGLDPQISPNNAEIQTARVAKARGALQEDVKRLVERATETPTLGLLGEPRVNVLKLNLALDEAYPMKKN